MCSSDLQAVPSYASMVCAISGQYSDDVDPLEVGPYWRDRFVVALRAFTEVRTRRPDRIVDVGFKDQMSDPVGTAARVLGELGIPADRDALEAYMARNKEERHGSHTYTAADFGLSEAGLEKDFAFYEKELP